MMVFGMVIRLRDNGCSCDEDNDGVENNIYYKNNSDDFDDSYFVNLSVSALGTYDRSTIDFIDMITKLNFDKRTNNYIIKKVSSIAIRTSYYIICRWNKELSDPELMTLKYSCFDDFLHQVIILNCLTSS